MANIKITELAELTSVASSDVLPVVDVSDGATKNVKPGNLVIAGAKELARGTEAAPAVAFGGATDANTGIYSPGADQVAISTAGTGKLFVDSSGNVGLGTNAPVSILHAKASNALTSDWGNLGITSQFDVNSVNRIYTGLQFNDGAAKAAGGVGFAYDGTGYKLHLATAASTSSGLSTRLTIDRSGNVGVGTTDPGSLLHAAGKIRFGSNASYYGEIDHDAATEGSNIYDHSDSGGHIFRKNGTEQLRIDSSGRLLVGTDTAVANGAKLQTVDGITFPATQVASADPNTLDDYEEGTHTTSVTTTGGSITLDSNNDTLAYVKIGKLVTVHGRVSVQSISSPTGGFLLSLPFTSANLTDSAGRAAASLNIRLVGAGYDVGLFSSYVDEGSANLAIAYGGSTDSTNAAPAITASTQIWVSVTYTTV